jgi:CRP-like cAMP-binding protein
MTIENDIAYLERVPLFSRLGAGALRILAIGIESYDVQAGQVLFTAGDAADGAYIIKYGSFSLKPEPAGDEVIAGRGTLLGESALFAETKRPATATAREGATIMRISRAMFLRMLEGYPDAAARLREMIASRSNQSMREIQNIRDMLAGDED